LYYPPFRFPNLRPVSEIFLSDYLEKEAPDDNEARLEEQGEEKSDERKKLENEGGTSGTKDPKLSRRIESDSPGADPSMQRVITYQEFLERKKTTKPFRADTTTGESQQEV
jgi:hypothetical protein